MTVTKRCRSPGLPYLKHTQRLLRILWLLEKLDPHALEGRDDIGGGEAVLSFVVECPQPLG